MSDAKELERLLDQHWGIVRKVAGVYSFDPADTDDLTQEICLQMWRSFRRYDPARPFSTWAYRVALNTAISFRRRAGRRRVRTVEIGERDVPTPAPEPPTDRAEALHRFVRRQDHLTRALVLLHLEGHDRREIAEILGLSETNVSTRLSRFRKRARRELTSTEDQTGGADRG